MKRIYQGNYYDIDQHGEECPYSFKMEVVLDERFNFIGTVWEEEFSCISGKHLSVKGYIDEDHISFVKQYPCLFEYDEKGNVIIDESKSGHHVIYDGYWDETNSNWIGEWEVEGENEVFKFDMIKTRVYLGKFEMKMLE